MTRCWGCLLAPARLARPSCDCDVCETQRCVVAGATAFPWFRAGEGQRGAQRAFASPSP